jgi:oligopeptidase B
MAILGGSAGGLLIGAVLNLRPEPVPRGRGQSAVRRRAQYHAGRQPAAHRHGVRRMGHPNEAPYLEYIRSYSPYDNVEPKTYPNLPITAGLNDPRVS